MWIMDINSRDSSGLWSLESYPYSVPSNKTLTFAFRFKVASDCRSRPRFPSLIWPFYPGFLPSSAALTPFFCWEKWNAYRETASPPGRGVSDPMHHAAVPAALYGTVCIPYLAGKSPIPHSHPPRDLLSTGRSEVLCQWGYPQPIMVN